MTNYVPPTGSPGLRAEELLFDYLPEAQRRLWCERGCIYVRGKDGVLYGLDQGRTIWRVDADGRVRRPGFNYNVHEMGYNLPRGDMVLAQLLTLLVAPEHVGGCRSDACWAADELRTGEWLRSQRLHPKLKRWPKADGVFGAAR